MKVRYAVCTHGRGQANRPRLQPPPAGRNKLGTGRPSEFRQSPRMFGYSRPRVQAGTAAESVGRSEPLHPHGAETIVTLHSPVMILPQVHLRKPCYDFYFL